MTVVRAATLADLPGLARTHTRSIVKAYAEILHPDDLAIFTEANATSRFDERIRNGEHVLLGEVDNVAAGNARWGELTVEDWPYQNLVHTLFVDPDFQGLGVGRALLSSCASHAKQKSHEGMMIGCLTSNHLALEMYKWLGAREVEEEPIQIGEHSYPNVFLAWDDLSELVARLTSKAEAS